MRIEATQAFFIILVMALTTFATRVLPHLLFSRGQGGQPPPWVSYLGNVLPPAVIALLVVYCLREVDIFSSTHGLPEFLCVVICALLHLWKRNEFLSIFGSTLLYMLLVQVVFV